MSSYIDNLIKKNEAPILFIGSGISRRYLEKSPDWISLLKIFWDKLEFEEDFYGKLNELRNNMDIDDEIEKNFCVNIKIASLIEERYNLLFNRGIIQLANFTTEDAYKTGISPFKVAVSDLLKMYKEKEEKQEEIQSFNKLVKKAQIIITTNYDTFIEDQYEDKKDIDVYIGSKGFFLQSFDCSEIYKIHGCVTSPQNIIITEKDYDDFKNKEILVSSKIVAMLMDNPIIFLGYSMTDLNIRNIIKSISSSLSPEELQIFSDKVTVVEWKKGENEIIEEMQNDRELGCVIRIVKTDNYRLLFDKISEIDSGVPLSLVRKFKSKIKELIIGRAKEGELERVLVSEKELDDVDVNQEKNLVVALGSDKIIFKMPNFLGYCIDYISEDNVIDNDIKLRYISTQNSTSRFPGLRLLKDEIIERSCLDASEKEKLFQLKRRLSDEKYHKGKVSKSLVFLETSEIEKILYSGNGDNKINETIAFNIEDLDLQKVKEYILQTLNKLKENGEKASTSFRKVMLLYDIRKCKEDNA